MTAPFVNSQAFLEYLAAWQSQLPVLSYQDAFPQPEKAAVLSVDIINGFCYEGPLSSPRVKAIIHPIVDLMKGAWERGVHQILLLQDTHDPQAVEFGQFPPHCVRGTHESESVPELKALPFYPQMRVIEKNSINAALYTDLGKWLADHPGIDTFAVVGDCTDLCTYQLAMYLRLDANARQLQRRVIVPANAVDTYDMPVATARQIGAMPHDGDLLHAVFLYHMALNGVEVVCQVG